MVEETPQDDPLQSLIAEILDAESRGESVDHEAFVCSHPEFEKSLREFFANHDAMKGGTASEEDTLPPGKVAADDVTLPPNQAAGEEATLTPLDNQSGSEAKVGDKVRYFGDYELLQEIARGGMGVVYKARQINLNRIVALKMILSGQLASEEDVLRFHTEAEAAANLDHPGIVPIFEIGEHQGQHYFSMGYIEGESLADRLADGPLQPKEAAEIVMKVCEAMAYAHERGVIHRDLKPANILIDQKGQPKVTDFGLAKKTEADSNLTGTGQILGTPSYMAPEQASGNGEEVGPLADVYALGAILYCLLSGRPPFQTSNPMDTLLQVLDREPIPLRQQDPSIPVDLETISLKCLSKDKTSRYPGADELKADLGRFVEGEPILARPISRIEKSLRYLSKHHARIFHGTLVLTLAILFALTMYQNFSDYLHPTRYMGGRVMPYRIEKSPLQIDMGKLRSDVDRALADVHGSELRFSGNEIIEVIVPPHIEAEDVEKLIAQANFSTPEITLLKGQVRTQSRTQTWPPGVLRWHRRFRIFAGATRLEFALVTLANLGVCLVGYFLLRQIPSYLDGWKIVVPLVLLSLVLYPPMRSMLGTWRYRTIVAKLESNDPAIQLQAISDLGDTSRLSREHIESIFRSAFSHPKSSIRFQFADALNGLDDEQHRYVVDLLRHEIEIGSPLIDRDDSSKDRRAILASFSASSHAQRLVPLLLEALRHDNSKVAEWGAYGFGQIPPKIVDQESLTSLALSEGKQSSRFASGALVMFRNQLIKESPNSPKDPLFILSDRLHADSDGNAQSVMNIMKNMDQPPLLVSREPAPSQGRKRQIEVLIEKLEHESTQMEALNILSFQLLNIRQPQFNYVSQAIPSIVECMLKPDPLSSEAKNSVYLATSANREWKRAAEILRDGKVNDPDVRSRLVDALLDGVKQIHGRRRL